MYLSSLRVAAASAADAARTDDMTRYEAATVFVTVASQVALRPSRQRIEVKQVVSAHSRVMSLKRIEALDHPNSS